MKVFHIFVTGLAFIVNLPSVVLTEEQSCYNKFEYEYNVIEQLIILKQKLERQERVSADLKKELNGKLFICHKLHDMEIIIYLDWYENNK
jgi:hypothetical protein